MNSISMIKVEPIEFDNNCIVVDTTVVSASMQYSNLKRKRRKTICPSKTEVQTSFIHQLNKSSNVELEKHSTDNPLTLVEQLDHADEGTSMKHHHHLSSKRPKLNFNKRLQANARERERVHNLTAAFEALRKAIPMYGDQSKLSRLSILRIACSYVHVLGVLNEIDFSEGQNSYTLNESFHMLSCTILNELQRKKVH